MLPGKATASAASQPNVLIRWNSATLQAMPDAELGAPVVARRTYLLEIRGGLSIA
jgi:hypothetical protein